MGLNMVVVNCVWAAVAVGALWVLNRWVNAAAVYRQVKGLEREVADLRASVVPLVEEQARLVFYAKDAAFIRAELEKLKAIPTKGPRY